MSSVQLIKASSTFETIYPADSIAAESDKLIRLSFGYKNAAIDYSKIVNINIKGYIRDEANNAVETSERATMRQRLDDANNSLIRLGVPKDKIWITGIAYSSNRAGQIDISVIEVNLNSIILPPYPPYIPSVNPQQNSGNKEQWLDSEGGAVVDPLSGEMTMEIEISFKENGILKTKPPVKAKVALNPDGSLGSVELSTELALIKQEIAKKAAGGLIQDVKFKIAASGSAKFKLDDSQQLKTELNAKLKAALSFDLVIPKTKHKLPIEASLSVGIDGKVKPGVSITIFQW
jgi:hypothetical protein